jgi:predicted amidohydrolase
LRHVEEVLLEVANPDPHQLTSLRVWRIRDEVMVGGMSLARPEFAWNTWCYEGGMEFLDCRDLGQGRLELRHRLIATPEILVVTHVIPEIGAVEFLARLEREDGHDDPWPENPAVPNLCWQLKPSPVFASRPEPYPNFFARCFIFTADGRTFLDRTVRRPIPARVADDARNHPPWVQIYGPAAEPPKRSPPGAWADYSPARFTFPIIGAVSRDQKYLTAIATGSASSLCQAWHDCMHINSSWGSPDGRTWRMKVYAMENDPTKLLAAVAADFPEIRGPVTSPPSPTHVRVAVAQFRSSTDLADNVARMKVQIAAAASRGAQVIVFPECAISSYFQEAITKLTEAELLAAEREVLAACREHRIEAIIGTPYFRDGQLYNGALIVNAEGDVIARHDKVHLVGGDTAWNCAPGSQPPPVFRLGGAWSSVVICHDSRYPELTRLPVLAGARVIYYISHEASVARETKLIPYRAQVQARAVENGVFVVHANAPADDVRRGSHGQSRIVAPDGNLISEASIFEDELLLADLELAQANAENGLRSLERSPLSDWWREGLQQVRVIE